MRVKNACNYKNLITEIGDLIDVTGYSSDHIAPIIGLSINSFVAKKTRNNFSVDEVEKLVCLLGKDNVENYLMLKIMDARKDEPTVSLADVMSQMGWQ